MVSEQLTLPISQRESDTFTNFEVGENRQLIDYLTSGSLLDSPENRIVYISGESGCGKTHCLYALCHLAEQHQISACLLDAEQLCELKTEVLDGLEYTPLICVDNVHRLAGNREWQIAIFDLINRVLELDRGTIVVTGDAGPGALQLELPDLCSRLAWGLVHRLVPLNDEQRLSVICHRARLRSIPMTHQVASYLITHWRRDLPSLMELLDALDRLTLQQKRKLSVPFVREVINEMR